MLGGSNKKKKKVLIGVGESQPQTPGGPQFIRMRSVDEGLPITLGELLDGTPWWKQQGEKRGVVKLPNGQKAYYCETQQEMEQIQGASYPDICSVTISNTLASVFQRYCSGWRYVNVDENTPMAGAAACVGPHGNCPHVQYKKDAEGNEVVDECPTCENDNCIIVNDLREEVSRLEDRIEDLNDEIESKDETIAELEERIDEINDAHSDEMDELRDELSGEFQSEIDDLEEKVGNLEERIEELEEQVEEDCEGCDDKANEINILSDKIEELEEKIEELEEELERAESEKNEIAITTTSSSNIDINTVRTGTEVLIVEIKSNMCPEDLSYTPAKEFFKLGKTYTIYQVDRNDRRWNVLIRNDEGRTWWTNTQYLMIK